MQIRRINHLELFLALVLLLVLLFLSGAGVSEDTGTTDGDVSVTRFIKPLFGRVDKNSSDDRENQDQCAGTLRRYSFPPCGYEPPEPNARSRRGKALYDKLKCAQCHAIKAVGGELGPPLDGIGGHRGREWLIARLLDPEEQMRDFADVFDGRQNIMPHPAIDKRQAKQIASYLLTLDEPDAGYLITGHAGAKASKSTEGQYQPRPVDPSARRGAELFSRLYCASCHTIDGGKSRFAPDLGGIGARLSDSDLEKVLYGAMNASLKSSTMKAITSSIDEEARKDLKAFLLTLPE